MFLKFCVLHTCDSYHLHYYAILATRKYLLCILYASYSQMNISLPGKMILNGQIDHNLVGMKN